MNLDIAKEIAFSGRPEVNRPLLHRAFSYEVHGGETAIQIVDSLIPIVTGVTSGRVGFVHDPDRIPEVVIHIGFHDNLKSPSGGWYAGSCLNRVANGIILGAVVAIHPEWAFPKVILHELGHALGFCHTQQPGPFIMGGAPIEQDHFSEEEFEAWRLLEISNPGYRAEGADFSKFSAPVREWRCSEVEG